MHVRDYTCIPIFFVEETIFRFTLDGLSMAQMVIPDNIKPPFTQILCKFIIAVNVLHHAMAHLEHRFYLPFRFPLNRMDFRIPIL